MSDQTPAKSAPVTVWVITREVLPDAHSGPESDVRPHSVVASYDDVLDRMELVAIANRTDAYPLRAGSRDSTGRIVSWYLGPDDDEGFFGNRQMLFQARETKVAGSLVEIIRSAAASS